MDAINCSDEKSWNDALTIWHGISRDDGSCYVDTAEDEGGSDGIDERGFATMEAIVALESTHAPAAPCIMDEGRLLRQQPRRTLSLSTLCGSPVPFQFLYYHMLYFEFIRMKLGFDAILGYHTIGLYGEDVDHFVCFLD